MLLDIKKLQIYATKSSNRQGLWPHKEASQIPIIKELSLTLQEGELVALIGESGSGKTTLLNSIANLLPRERYKEEGHLIVGGQDVLSLDSTQRRAYTTRKITFIVQEAMNALNPDETIEEQLTETLRLHDVHRTIDLSSYLRSFGFVDVSRLLQLYPSQLSGGMKQRLVIALAMADPHCQLLLADEPTTALDEANRHAFLRFLKDQCQKRHMAMLYVTHDIQLVRGLCHRCLVMKEGRIMEEGPLERVYDHPKEAYTKALMTKSTLTTSIRKSPQSVSSLTEVCRLEGVKKTFTSKGTVQIGPLSFTIHEGERVGLVGPSGVGKSTIGKLILGLLTPDEGHLYWRGKGREDFSKDEQKTLPYRVQMIFQDPYESLNRFLTVGECIGEGLAYHPRMALTKDDKEAYIRALMAEVGLQDDLYGRRPRELSGGQCQRVGIARALGMQPELLIADECTSSLDVVAQDQIAHLLCQISERRNVACLFISHDLPLVRRLCHRIISL